MASCLIVDDSQLSREMIKEIIKDRSDIDVAGEGKDGVEAVQLYENLKPSFVTMDLEMPNVTGLQAAEQILRQDPEAKIILVTSIINKREINIAMKRGVKAAVTKPINETELLAAIDKILGGEI